MNEMNATIHERGNGFCAVNDHVAGCDGELYFITELYGPIHTGAAGSSNYIHAKVELADWQEVSENWVSQCVCVVDDE